MDDPASPQQNHPKGGFKRGHDPRRQRGRPPGARTKALTFLDKLGEDGAADIVRAVIAAAQKGDLGAAALVLARAWPPRRGRPVALDLPPVASADDLAAAMSAVTAALASGTLTPDEAQAVAAVLEGHRRALETSDIEKRLAALEAQKAHR